MEPTVALLLLLAAALVIVAVRLSGKLDAAAREQQALRVRLDRLDAELARLRTAAPPPAMPPPSAVPAPVAAPPSPPIVAAVSAPPPAAEAGSTPPLLASRPFPPPAAAALRPAAAPVRSALRPARSLNWEQFMGAKLFAWLGGFAAFLAVAFFVKYSFEHELIPPEVRVAIGFLLSTALLAGGLRIRRETLRVTAQVLCATGIVSLYAVTFACHAVYHFTPFSVVPTFALMAAITAVAFVLAVRRDAQVVALLGLLGGFLTPLLLSTGQDNPLGLFGYLALLDAGLLAVALHRRWFHLAPLAAAGTVLLQIAWAVNFLTPAKASTAVVVCLGFAALFFTATEIARRLARSDRLLTTTAAALSLISFGFAFSFLAYPAIAHRPALLLSFVFLADSFLLALAWRDASARRLHLLGGNAVFALLAAWTAGPLTASLLPWALAAALLFAVLHTAFPLVLDRRHPGAATTRGNQLFPPLALVLVLVPLFKFAEVSLLFWPVVLLVDALAVGLALLSGSRVAVAAVLILTSAATGVCLFKDAAAHPAGLYAAVAGFALFFFSAGLFLVRRLGPANAAERPGVAAVFGDPQAQLPAFSALLPFVLLIMMSQRLPLADPAPLFGLALLLNVLVLGLARLLLIAWLPACALLGTAALEHAWHLRLFEPSAAGVPLAWYLGFYALFASYPFVFRRAFAALTGPWAVAAAAGLAHFWLVYDTIERAWPNDFPGVLAAAFAVAPLASFAAVLRLPPVDPAHRTTQLAWFGGVALAFITLIFPLQFERQWITLGWAFEGVALLWLFHRVPHAGLRATGVVLLALAFARLALNPAVLSYHARGGAPVFNWYLYAYGLAALSLFAGARLTAPPRDRALGLSAPALLNTLGTVLAFLLLNLEIADYFTPAGRTLTFQFSGSFARDLAYTIGWALFALALLAAGIWRHTRAARYAALALLTATALKLFLHDLAHLAQLYRVGALIAVAAVAILASFLYQRFAPGRESEAPASDS